MDNLRQNLATAPDPSIYSGSKAAIHFFGERSVEPCTSLIR
jgi:hypothetical protein